MSTSSKSHSKSSRKETPIIIQPSPHRQQSYYASSTGTMTTNTTAMTSDSGYNTDGSREYEADGNAYDYKVVISKSKTKEKKPVTVFQHHAPTWDVDSPHPPYNSNKSHDHKEKKHGK